MLRPRNEVFMETNEMTELHLEVGIMFDEEWKFDQVIRAPTSF